MSSHQQIDSRLPAVAIVLAAVTTSTAVVLLHRFFFEKRKATEDEKQLPSPSPEHLIWGHAPLLPSPTDGPIADVQLLQWSKDLGSTVFRYRVPIFGNLVVVGDPDLAHHALVQHNFPKSFFYKFSGPLVGPKSMVSSAHREPHQSRRRLFHKGFQPDYLNQECLGLMKDKTVILLEQCALLGPEITLLDVVRDYTSNIISSVAFGQDWSSYTHPARAALREITHSLTILMEGSQAWNILNPFVWFKCWQHDRILKREMKAIVVEKFKTKGNDIVSLAAQELMKNKPKGSIPDNDDIETMIDQLKTLYFAGHDTTSSLISWTIWLLAQHDSILTKLRVEVKDKLSNDWYTATAAKYKDCSYLDAVLKEVLRLYPATTVSRGCNVLDKEALKWKGYRLDKHTTLLFSHYVMHRSTVNWGPDAEDFRPERFLEKNPNLKAFMPFSKGVYDCLGKSFALLEAKVAVAAFVSRFDVTAIEPAKEALRARLTFQPKHGCRVALTSL